MGTRGSRGLNRDRCRCPDANAGRKGSDAGHRPEWPSAGAAAKQAVESQRPGGVVHSRKVLPDDCFDVASFLLAAPARHRLDCRRARQAGANECCVTAQRLPRQPHTRQRRLVVPLDAESLEKATQLPELRGVQAGPSLGQVGRANLDVRKRQRKQSQKLLAFQGPRRSARKRHDGGIHGASAGSKCKAHQDERIGFKRPPRGAARAKGAPA